MKMTKPEKHKTTHWIYGIDVKDKDIVEVPDHLISLFKKEGFKEVDNGKKKVDTRNRNKKRSTS